VKRCIQTAQSFALGEDPNAMTDAQVCTAFGLLGRVAPARIEVLVSENEGRRACSETENE
jgi:hypothetical protein